MTADLLVVASSTTSPLSTDSPIPTDEIYKFTRHPFPFRVARWVEVDTHYAAPWCDWPVGTHAKDCIQGCRGIVELVEVTGPSHHADDLACQPTTTCSYCMAAANGSSEPCDDDHFCHPGALPDSWHTPTGTLTRLSEPIPCERPFSLVGITDLTRTLSPASVWIADDELARRLREVMADD